MARPTWARWITRASLVLGAAALVWTLHDVGLRTFDHFFKLIGVFWIAVLAFETAITSLDAVAISAFASPDRVSLRTSLLAQLAGRSVNAVTPGGNLGEPVKISILGERVSGSRAVSTILLYNIVSFSVELWQVALAAPLLAWLYPMSPALRWLFLGTGAISLVGALGSYLLVRRGMLASIVGLGAKLRLLSNARYTRWSNKVRGIDDKMRLVAGASRRSRLLGIAAIVASRALSLCESLVLLHAMGMPISIAFVAAYTVGGLPIYFLSTLVPMGLGIAETGYYGLFAELGYNPVLGFMLVVARRCVLIAYATIGLVLVAMSETVRRARENVTAELPAIALPIATETDA
jgi:uncharacterized protein (TIRG00374 family)